jgi:hypothetical protein
LRFSQKVGAQYTFHSHELSDHENKLLCNQIFPQG